MSEPSPHIVVGITGASGAAYATRLVACLAEARCGVHVIVSPHGRQLLADELDIRSPSPALLAGEHARRVFMHSYRDLASKLASGSFLTRGMVVCPASSNTMGAIAAGLGDNLITRAAHVTLKERRRLILVPRETPLTRIELENMLRICDAGGIICPASPGFYMQPRTVQDLVDFVVGKVMDLLGMPHRLDTRWAGMPAETSAAGSTDADDPLATDPAEPLS